MKPKKPFLDCLTVATIVLLVAVITIWVMAEIRLAEVVAR